MSTTHFIYILLIGCLNLVSSDSTAQNLSIWGAAGNDAISALSPTADGGRLGLLFYEQQSVVGDSSYQSLGSNDFLLIRWDALQQVQWVIPISSASALELEGFVADSTGAGYAIFQSNTSQYWAGQQQVAPAYSSVLYAWDAAGQFRWSYAFESPLFQRFSSVDADEGSVYIAGYFSDSLHCADSSWMAAGVESPFVARLSSSGQLLWGSTLPHKPNATVQVQALTLLGAYCYVAGDFVDSLFLPQDTLYAAGAAPDIFLLRYDSVGNIIQSQSFNGVLTDRIRQLESDATTGKLYIAGEMQGQLRFGPTMLVTAIQAYDAFIVQIDSSGHVDWAKKLYAEANNYSNSIAVREGRIWQTGYFLDSFWVEGRSIQSQAGFDGYVLVWDSLGQLQQAVPLSGSGAILPQVIRNENNGQDWIVGGSFSQSWQNATASGGTDAFIFEGDQLLFPIEQPLPTIIDLAPFPNPSQNIVQLPLAEQQLLYWELFDTSGRLVAKGKTATVNLSAQPKGIYSIFIYMEEGIAIEKLQRN